MDVKKEYFELVECQTGGVDFSPFLRFEGTYGTSYLLPLRRGGFHDALEMMRGSEKPTPSWSFCPWCGEKLAG